MERKKLENKSARPRPPLKRAIEVRVAGEKAAKTLVFDGRPLDIRL